ncbi:MAG: MFS transporter [Comamonas sp.]
MAQGGDKANNRNLVLLLGTTQTLSWASSFYLPAVLAPAMAADLGVAPPTVFAAFSVALVVTALLGPKAGRLIDQRGGRQVLGGSHIVFALGLVALAWAPSLAWLWAAWLWLGVGMALGLYEGAFAAIVRVKGRDAKTAITGVTLIAGFASTVGWPLSAWMATTWGWREACLVWAALHLLLGLPLAACLPGRGVRAPEVAASETPAAAAPAADAPAAPAAAVPWHVTALLAFAFAACGFVTSAVASHLPQLLQLQGLSLGEAVMVGALIGPSQVAARLLDFVALRSASPLWSARLASLAHAAAVLLLWGLGNKAAPVFGVVHGAGNGVLTIARGTLPLQLYGPAGYGRQMGWIHAPGRFAQALAPWGFGWCMQWWGASAFGLTLALSLLAGAALCALRLRPPAV